MCISMNGFELTHMQGINDINGDKADDMNKEKSKNKSGQEDTWITWIGSEEGAGQLAAGTTPYPPRNAPPIISISFAFRIIYISFVEGEIYSPV